MVCFISWTVDNPRSKNKSWLKKTKQKNKKKIRQFLNYWKWRNFVLCVAQLVFRGGLLCAISKTVMTINLIAKQAHWLLRIIFVIICSCDRSRQAKQFRLQAILYAKLPSFLFRILYVGLKVRKSHWKELLERNVVQFSWKVNTLWPLATAYA